MRTIGIVHRVKISAKGEPRPTKVAILENGDIRELELATEQDEQDFVLGTHKGSEGLREGDTVAMALGGSGDYLAYALARHGDEIGAAVIRVPSFVLKNERNSATPEPVRFGESVEPAKKRRGKVKAKEKTEGDHVLLAELAKAKPQLFYPLAAADRDLIVARERWRALWEVMQARMGSNLRLQQLYIGRTFTHPDGLFPEGGIEKGFDKAKTSDKILNALLKEEKSREKELVKALENLAVYREVFKPIEGVGPKIAGRIIAAVADIRRFQTAPQLKAFCGVHVLADGSFPRRRVGKVANWHGDARQALFLLGEQFNRRPDSTWGTYLREMKKNLRRVHPVPVEVEVPDKEKGGTKMVKRYSDGHIHKMALWRTLSRFVEKLHADWWELETGSRPERRKAA